MLSYEHKSIDMKTTLLSGILILAFSATQAQTKFVRVYDQLTDNTSIAYSIKATPDGGLISIGSTNNEINPDVFIIKTDGNGGAEWASQYSGQNDDKDLGLDIVSTQEGGFVFCGTSDNQRVIWKLDNLGKEQWKHLSGGEDAEAFIALTETNDGGFVAVGDGMLITKVDENGNEMWVRNKPTDHKAAYRTVKELPNGDLLIGGFFTARDQGHAISILVKTDSSGKAYWAESYGPGIINAIDTDSEGNIWLAGSASFAAPVVLKVSPEGKAVWEGVYDKDQLGNAHSISAKSDGGALVFTAGGYFEINAKGDMKDHQTTTNFGFNKGFVNEKGEMVMAGFSDESIAGYEKFSFLKMGKDGFPLPIASAE